ncbi:dirigent protein 22-like [Macadamia integrifolia]|uniref:dirigent protein 22-like n=1 Tax=Macadamia integrifolia TaxID=60698 RepID=UPI001C52C74B|nr:dirigent protein 22-like [Macadamia integrifolia]
MAIIHISFSSSSVICLTILFLFSNNAVNGKSRPLLESLGFKHEKITHLHFFFHDIVSGSNPTAIKVAQPSSTKNSQFPFGTIVAIDDPLTETPELNSTLVGRAQGLYTLAAQNELALLMTLNFVFTGGKYNGSTLSLFGRNPVQSAVREIPVTGGTGIFRLARGYAQAKTQFFNLTSGDAVVEYNVYVIHY